MTPTEPTINIPGHAKRGIGLHVITGPNGSGKTTLLRHLAGLAPLHGMQHPHPTTQPMATQRPKDAFVGLTVQGEWRLREWPMPSTMQPWKHRDVATLSHGESRRVSLALLDLPSPLCLLDEPLDGLDQDAMRDAMNQITSWSQDRIVVATDHTGHLESIATTMISLGDQQPRQWPSWHQGDGATTDIAATTLTRNNKKWNVHKHAWRPGLHAVTGTNGAGKSTYLWHLRSLGWPLLADDPRHILTETTVLDCLAGTEAHITSQLVPDNWLARHPWTLSGGEAQRVALAKVLGQSSSCYALDEPDRGLDPEACNSLTAILQKRLQEGASIVLASHDAALVASTHSQWEVPA